MSVVLRCTVKTHEVCKNQHSPKLIARTGSYINGKLANIYANFLLRCYFLKKKICIVVKRTNGFQLLPYICIKKLICIRNYKCCSWSEKAPMSPKRMAAFIISYYFAQVYRLFSIKILENKNLL